MNVNADWTTGQVTINLSVDAASALTAILAVAVDNTQDGNSELLYAILSDAGLDESAFETAVEWFDDNGEGEGEHQLVLRDA